ncbi:putative lipoprotein [Citrobacter portucalensis]|nr:YjbH domain-containing protein [Citrobacter portucalensis]VEC18796.1 putative lipoprotein [Citrobacter portucalensis]
MRKTYLLSVLALGVSVACHGETWPAPIGPSQSDFGGVGLLQTPTARMAREGEMSLNYRDNDQYRYYSASVQLFPWLETTLRYTDVRTKKYSSVESFSGDQTYKDKAFDLKTAAVGRELLDAAGGGWCAGYWRNWPVRCGVYCGE